MSECGETAKTQGPGVFPLRALVPFLFRGIDNIVFIAGLVSAQVRSLRRNLSINSLAGDDNDGVLGLVLAGTLGEGLQAQLELIASRDLKGLLALGLVSNLLVVQSGIGVDSLVAHQQVVDLLSLSNILHILALVASIPGVLIGDLVGAQLSLDSIYMPTLAGLLSSASEVGATHSVVSA